MKRFNIIFAMDSQFGIGKDNQLPWGRIPADMEFFRTVTMRTRHGEYPAKPNVIIMGRKTWESLPSRFRPLPNRINAVITRNTPNTLMDEGCLVYNSLEQALLYCLTSEQYGDVFVIGGGEIFRQTLTDPKLGEVFVTEITGDYRCDTFIDRDLIDPLMFHTAEYLNTVSHPTNGKPIKFYRMETYRHADRIYGDLLRRLLLQGEPIQGRNGETHRITGDVQLAFSLMDGLPVLTGKKILWNKVVEELLFFIRGETDSKQLEARGVRFWQGNTTREFLDSRGLTEYPVGEMGPMYGYQWRHFNGEYSPGTEDSRSDQSSAGGIDQLRGLIQELQQNGASRRLLITTLNPADVDRSVLWPCHGLVVQFFVDTQNGLSCKMYQRSADTFLGLPFNIASYGLLTCILAKILGLTPRSLYITIGDCHIYDNHKSAVEEYLTRVPYDSPQLEISGHIQTLEDVEASTAEDYRLINYQHHPFIRAEMSA